MSKIDVILVTTATRDDLLDQSMRTIRHNAVGDIHLTTVVNSPERTIAWSNEPVTTSILTGPVGASDARNRGASSIPKYARGSHVAFFDDDVFCLKGWDQTLLDLSHALPGALVSGTGHPFNHGKLHIDEDGVIPPHTKPLVISTTCFFMPWSMWDYVGYFALPGGPGGSEDYDWCMRASKLGYGFAVSHEHCVIHTGLTSTTGKQIVGYGEMVQQNERLITQHGLKGVIWQ